MTGAVINVWCCVQLVVLCAVCCVVYNAFCSERCCVKYVMLCAVCVVLCRVSGAFYSVWCYVQCVVLCRVSGTVYSVWCCVQ